ncbi:MAG: hypothetical protein ACLTYN_15970 [Dysosmobacter welbionis]
MRRTGSRRPRRPGPSGCHRRRPSWLSGDYGAALLVVENVSPPHPGTRTATGRTRSWSAPAGRRSRTPSMTCWTGRRRFLAGRGAGGGPENLMCIWEQ